MRETLLPGRYRVLDQVAVGGMGSIWAAEDTVLGRQVAVKVLAEQLAAQPLFVRRFEREARTAAALSGHPHVITIYDVGEHAGRPFIVMAYLAGGTLKDRIERGAVDPGQAVEWLRQAASALDFAHSRGVVHRDVKPQNLLFDGDGRLVVADLGIARAAYEDSLTASGELLGTASYIAPEQAMGEPATPASDRYSLAIVAYELLTGARPFGGTSFAEQALAQVESKPDPPSARAPGLSPGVDAVLLKGLSKDPRERWESAEAFAEALDDALNGTVQAPGPAAPTPAPAPAAAPSPAPTVAERPRPLIDPERRWPREGQVTTTRRFRIRLAAVLAGIVALALVGGGAALIATRDGGDNEGSGKRAERAGRAERTPKKKDTPAPKRRKAQAPEPAAPAAPPAPASQPTSSGSPAALNDQGFALMRAGNYAEAIPVLQRAVAAFPAGSTDLTYAYALYNLGRSLRLAGRPAEAIPLLERRLRFQNQRDVVARELAAARAAAG